MTDKTQNWSKEWKSSTNPSKQRKYRQNAPLHVKEKIVSANVSPELREELETRSIPLRRGDQVRVMRGDKSDQEGIISKIDREDEKVYVNGVEIERNDGTVKDAPLRPSNLQITAMNVDDDKRVEKYDIDDFELVEVDEDEMEEVLEEDEEDEMMEQMQQKKEARDAAEAEEEDEKTEDSESEEEESKAEEESEAETEEVDYSSITNENIGDAKDALQDLGNPDYEAALEAEKKGKNRKTFIDWLENQVEE